MSRLIRSLSTGGPEVLQWVGVMLRRPLRARAPVRHLRCRPELIDVYHRSGLTVPLPRAQALKRRVG